MKKFLAGLATGFFLLGMVGLANATLINFASLPTYQANEITIGDLSITASGTIDVLNSDTNAVLNLAGLGVDNGTGGTNALDASEWMTFSFLDNPATDVIFNLSFWGNGGDIFRDTWFTLSSYDKTGTPLGSYSAQDIEEFSFNVNSLTGANQLSSFTIQMDNDSTRIYSMSYDAAPVPEPATMLLFGTGLAGLVNSRFRRKNKA